MRTLGISSTPLALGLFWPGLDDEQAAMTGEAFSALRAADLIDAEGDVDGALAGWLQVLGDPDIVASAEARIGNRLRTIVVARKGIDHVLALRIDDEIVIQSIGSQARSVDDLVAAPLWDALRLSQENMDPPPAQMQSVTFSWELSRSINRKYSGDIPNKIQDAMNRTGLTAQILNELATSTQGQRCGIMIQQSSSTERVYTPAAVLVADTRFGRVVSGTRKEGSQMVTTVGDGTYNRFRAAICDLIVMTPSQDWFTTRR
jgi:EspG family